MEICSNYHDEIVHTGNCPMCALQSTLHDVTEDRDEFDKQLNEVAAERDDLKAEVASLQSANSALEGDKCHMQAQLDRLDP